MSAIVNLGRFSVTENSYRRAREMSAARTANTGNTATRKTAQDVLNIIREAKPGWVVDTTTANWQPGARNLQIGHGILERMANDPEAMVQYKAFILDLEYAADEIEAWQAENPDYQLTFNFNLALDQAAQAVATVRTLLGQETRSSFEVSSENRASWQDFISQKLDSIAAGRVEEADGSQSWAG